MILIGGASLADDVFEVNDVDPDGKKFTKGTMTCTLVMRESDAWYVSVGWTATDERVCAWMQYRECVVARSAMK